MNDSRLIALCASVMLVLMIFGGSLVASGLAIGFLTAAAFLVLAMKSKLIRGFARRFPVLADLLATALGYLLFPAGITAFVAAGTVALLVTIMIAVDRLRRPEPDPGMDSQLPASQLPAMDHQPAPSRAERGGGPQAARPVGGLLARVRPL